MLHHANLIRTLGLAIGLVVLTATSVLADGVFIGTTAGGPAWDRPIHNFNLPPTPPLSLPGTNVRYSITQLTVSTSGSYTFRCVGFNFPNLWDNYTFMYQNSFDPLSQFNNVLIGNDDFPTNGLSGFTLNLNAGTNYFFIVTGFAHPDFGAWETVVFGPGTITVAPVPEPMSLLLLGTGLLGVAAKLRRRRKVM